jgi:hydrogenase expression/formation protein HypE
MHITLSHGAGGKQMQELVAKIRTRLGRSGRWMGSLNDAALIRAKKKNAPSLLFTADSYIVDPLFFPGGDIGKLAVCGTINDLAVSGAEPLGLSLSFVIEEGFPEEKLMKIVDSVAAESKKNKVPIVTGDTKVMPKGKLDGIIINTAGIGTASAAKPFDRPVSVGDKILVSGGIGEHATALLATRFNYKTKLKSDCQSLLQLMRRIRPFIKQAKDPTRGGLAASLNEIAQKNSAYIRIIEGKVPIRSEVRAVCSMLGFDHLTLACEGRAVVIVSEKNAAKALRIMQQYDKDAAIIGEIAGSVHNRKPVRVIMETSLGQRIVEMPSGELVPRIC